MEVINKIYNYIRDFFIYFSFRSKPTYSDLNTNDYDETEHIIFNQMIR